MINNFQRCFMMIRVLTAMLILFVANESVCLSDNKLKIVTGVGVVAGLWSYWSHVSNENAISGAEKLWNACQSSIGQERYCMSDTLERSLQNLQSSAVMMHAEEIVLAHASLTWKNRFCWNRSSRMKKAVDACEVLKNSLEEYENQISLVKQKIAIHKVCLLWEDLSKYDLSYDPSVEVIKGSTLQHLLRHEIVTSGNSINNLYAELRNARSLCYEFEQALEKITALKKALDAYQGVIDEISVYDEIVVQNADMLKLLVTTHRSDVVMMASNLSSGEFPLLSYVQKLNNDINRLSLLKLSFGYLKFSNNATLSVDNARTEVIRHLKSVECEIVSHAFYKCELRFYNEKLRMEAERKRMLYEQYRLQREQRDLNQKIQKITMEVTAIKSEKDCNV